MQIATIPAIVMGCSFDLNLEDLGVESLGGAIGAPFHGDGGLFCRMRRAGLLMVVWSFNALLSFPNSGMTITAME